MATPEAHVCLLSGQLLPNLIPGRRIDLHGPRIIPIHRQPCRKIPCREEHVRVRRR